MNVVGNFGHVIYKGLASSQNHCLYSHVKNALINNVTFCEFYISSNIVWALSGMSTFQNEHEGDCTFVIFKIH